MGKSELLTWSHCYILFTVDNDEARYYYIHRAAEEHLSVEQLKKIINENDFESRASMPNNFPRTISNSSLARKVVMMYLRILDDKVRKPHENPSIGIVLCGNANKDFVKYVIQDYNKPMGVATFDTLSEMPERLQKALPDIEELKKLL